MAGHWTKLRQVRVRGLGFGLVRSCKRRFPRCPEAGAAIPAPGRGCGKVEVHPPSPGGVSSSGVSVAEILQTHPQSKNINVLSSHLLSPQVSEECSQSRQCFFQLKFQMLKPLIPKSLRDYLCSPCENKDVVCFLRL